MEALICYYNDLEKLSIRRWLALIRLVKVQKANIRKLKNYRRGLVLWFRVLFTLSMEIVHVFQNKTKPKYQNRNQKEEGGYDFKCGFFQISQTSIDVMVEVREGPLDLTI